MYALTIDEYFIAFDASKRKWKTSSVRETRIIICLQREMKRVYAREIEPQHSKNLTMFMFCNVLMKSFNFFR